MLARCIREVRHSSAHKLQFGKGSRIKRLFLFALTVYSQFMEKPPRLRPHERLHGVNPHIKEYADKLVAGSIISTLPDGRHVRLADPVEHGYVVDPPSERPKLQEAPPPPEDGSDIPPIAA